VAGIGIRVLIVIASRHGATWEIGERIGQVLRRQGIVVVIAHPADVSEIANYQAVIVGSAVYMGQWLKAARSFVKEFSDELFIRPVWLFSSGPVGDPPQPPETHALYVNDIISRTHAIGHRLFRGRLERRRLRAPEALLVNARHIQDGDYRNWPDIEAWAQYIGQVLQPHPLPQSPRQK
jgi:menaquinone-dependent protoporphyrinogen oxidase